MIARPHIANTDQATKQKYHFSIKCMTDIAVNWSLYDTCIPHNPADGPRGRRVSTDCRGRLGGTGGSPTIQLMVLYRGRRVSTDCRGAGGTGGSPTIQLMALEGGE